MEQASDLFPVLLRELVADITLSDNVQSTLCTSLLAGLCQGVDRSLLGTWLQDTDERMVEEEVILGACPNAYYCKREKFRGKSFWA